VVLAGGAVAVGPVVTGSVLVGAVVVGSVVVGSVVAGSVVVTGGDEPSPLLLFPPGPSPEPSCALVGGAAAVFVVAGAPAPPECDPLSWPAGWWW
jgi:hypothetical protein